MGTWIKKRGSVMALRKLTFLSILMAASIASGEPVRGLAAWGDAGDENVDTGEELCLEFRTGAECRAVLVPGQSTIHDCATAMGDETESSGGLYIALCE